MIDPVVELQSDRIRGVTEKHEEGFDYYAFKGIPYAEPPVGDLRFQDPIPKRKWIGELDCQNYGPICLQYDFFLNFTSYNEDCLTLNVFTKSINQPNTNTPVMVFLHAGTFLYTSSNDVYHGPEYLIRKDLVLVTLNFRLGVLGFLNLEDEIAPGNQGLKDQIMALQWIQENIRAFGGDPNNVTVYGVGSGGISAHYLSVSPLAKGLVHKIIIQASVIQNTWHNIYNPKSYAVKFCSLLGKELTDSKEIFDFLKSLDPVALLETQERLKNLVPGFLHFGPGVDDKSSNPVMPVDPNIAANQGVHLPCLVGYNSCEGIIALEGMSMKDFFDAADRDFDLLLKYNAKNVLNDYDITQAQLRRLYYKNEVISVKNLDCFVDLTTDTLFAYGVHNFVKVQVEKSSSATYVYVYSYDHPGSISRKRRNIDSLSGPSHFDDLPCLFKMRLLEKLGVDYVKKGTRAYRMMEQMTELWANFAKYGRPTIETTELIPVHWQPINDAKILRYLNLDENITMQTTLHVDRKLESAKDIKV